MADPVVSTAARLPGLDTLRALAITWVCLYHYQIFVSHEASFGWVGTVGWVGVDLFFVLSGYLIANALFGGLVRGRPLSAPRFYARRAFRTLPVFWVVLALYFLWPGVMGGRTPPPLWRFLSFTQNFELPPGTAFSHAWSLCIEEQFYLVLPLVLLAGSRLRWGVVQGWALMAGLLALGITARCLLWQQYGLEAGNRVQGYHPHIYYATLCRFDEFLPGIAVAMLKHFHAPLWARIRAHGQKVLAAGVAATATLLVLCVRAYYIEGYGYGFFMTGFGYSLMAVAFALLVMAALCPGSWLHRWRVPGAHHLALWSYAIYLSHKGVAHALQQVPGLADGRSLITMGLVLLGSLLAGWVLHRSVEAPFLAWRDRLVPDHHQPTNTAPQWSQAKPT